MQKTACGMPVIYEMVGLILAVPLAAWGFGTDLVQTGVLGIFFSILAMDLGFTFFYIGYTYVYNWVYDRVFPYPGFKLTTCLRITDDALQLSI